MLLHTIVYAHAPAPHPWSRVLCAVRGSLPAGRQAPQHLTDATGVSPWGYTLSAGAHLWWVPLAVLAGKEVAMRKSSDVQGFFEGLGEILSEDKEKSGSKKSRCGSTRLYRESWDRIFGKGSHASRESSD